MTSYQVLDWDTKYFGFKVVKIIKNIKNIDELITVLDSAKKEKVTLVYWANTEYPGDDINLTIDKLGGLLVDEKITYKIDLTTTISETRNELKDVIIEPYNPSIPMWLMHALAIQSGEYSRFAVDPHIPREKYEGLYKIWIESSVNKQIANEVLVILEKGAVAGMITLGEKSGRGDIGLLAVDKKYRGKKYGIALVYAAHQWFVDHEYNSGQVVTQRKNQAACKLYEKCGYTVDTVEYYYHFWL